MSLATLLIKVTAALLLVAFLVYGEDEDARAVIVTSSLMVFAIHIITGLIANMVLS